MSLNDADKKRIYEEEEARLEARKKIEKKAKEKKERFQGAIGLAIISIILILVCSRDKPTTTESQANKVTNKYLYVNASALNVRSGPGTNYEIVKTLSMGQKVPVYETRGNWVKIQSDPTPGYVHKGYLGTEKRSTRITTNRIAQTKSKETHTTLRFAPGPPPMNARLHNPSGVSTPVPVNESAFNELIECAKTKDQLGLVNMLMDGKLMDVPNYTRVLVVRLDFSKAKIRILEGEYTGMTGWIIPEWLIN